MHVHRQNAGLLVTRVGAEMRFEALQLLAPDDIVVGCEGRLRRCFPACAVAVDRHRAVDPAFLQPFLDVLHQLDLDAADKPYDDEPTDPKLVNDMFLGVLRGIGRDLTADDVVYIGKQGREEALREVWPDGNRLETEFFWRSSPLWLLIRVALQLTLDRAGGQRGDGGGQQASLYKAFMVFLMSFVLERAAREHVLHDLLLFMKAKISRRVLKLGPAGMEAAWYGFPRDVLRSVDAMLTES